LLLTFAGYSFNETFILNDDFKVQHARFHFEEIKVINSRVVEQKIHAKHFC